MWLISMAERARKDLLQLAADGLRARLPLLLARYPTSEME